MGWEAATNVRVIPELPPGDLADFAYGSVAVVGGLAQQLHVVAVQLQGFGWRDRLVVKDVDVALHLPVEIVAQSPTKTEPACQTRTVSALAMVSREAILPGCMPR